MTKKEHDDLKVDVLCIGAHQDDIDFTIGGTIALLAEQGKKVEILDLTQRKGMYFSDEELRDDEAGASARILGVKRSLIDLGLLHVENNHENRIKIARFIRSRRPEVIITLDDDQTHPDHNIAHQLVLDAIHYAFATAIKTDLPPWRSKGLYFVPTNILFESIRDQYAYIDISKTYKRKKEAMMAYASQVLYHARNQKFELEYLETLNRCWGLSIGKEYAEIIIPRFSVIEPFPELHNK